MTEEIITLSKTELDRLSVIQSIMGLSVNSKPLEFT